MKFLKKLFPSLFRSETERALEACKGDCIPLRVGDE